jgi:hypothetical protein
VRGGPGMPTDETCGPAGRSSVAQHEPAGPNDRRTSAPTCGAHERFKLVERVECLVPAEDHHAGATAPDAVDLSAVLLDMAVPGDCHCCVVCGIQLTSGVSVLVTGHRGRRRPPFTGPPGSRGVGDVAADPDELLPQAEHVSVYVETHGRRLAGLVMRPGGGLVGQRPPHVARRDPEFADDLFRVLRGLRMLPQGIGADPPDRRAAEPGVRLDPDRRPGVIVRTECRGGPGRFRAWPFLMIIGPDAGGRILVSWRPVRPWCLPWWPRRRSGCGSGSRAWPGCAGHGSRRFFLRCAGPRRSGGW